MKLLPAAGFATGGFAVLLQFWLTVQLRIENGHSFGEAVIFFFSFFTILTNIGAILVYGSRLLPGHFTFFSRPQVRAAVAAAIAIVGIVYAAILAKLWAPEGLFWLCDVLLHYAAPLIYLSWWLVSGRNARLVWRDGLLMLVFPVSYLAYAMLRGFLTGLYPYPFLDAGQLGLGGALANAGGIAALFLAVSLAVIAIDRSLQPPAAHENLP